MGNLTRPKSAYEVGWKCGEFEAPKVGTRASPFHRSRSTDERARRAVFCIVPKAMWLSQNRAFLQIKIASAFAGFRISNESKIVAVVDWLAARRRGTTVKTITSVSRVVWVSPRNKCRPMKWKSRLDNAGKRSWADASRGGMASRTNVIIATWRRRDATGPPVRRRRISLTSAKFNRMIVGYPSFTHSLLRRL